VDVLGHNHIANHDELITPAHLLQYSEKQIAAARSGEQRLPLIATACNEVKVARAVVAMQIAPHEDRLVARIVSLQ